MLDIRITFLSILTDITEVEELTLSIADDSSIRKVLEQLAAKFGKKFEDMIYSTSNDLSKYIIITINGKDIRSLNGLKSIIQDHDEVSFIPAIAGG